MFKSLSRLLIAVILLRTGMTLANQKSSISGEAYFDYTHDISKDGPRTDGRTNGFRFRRFYITFDREISSQFSVRFQTDLYHGFGWLDHDLASASLRVSLNLFVREANLQWHGLLPGSVLQVGVIRTPTWEASEDWWAYRGLAATVWESFEAVAGIPNHSGYSDMGIALKGTLLSGLMAYHFVLGNGSNYYLYNSERDRWKKVYLSISILQPRSIVELYLDYEPHKGGKGRSIYTYKIFGGHQIGKFAAGAEYYYLRDGLDWTHYDSVLTNLKMSALSIFVKYRLKSNASILLRYDYLDPNVKLSQSETSVIIVGFDYRPHPAVHLIPNLYFYQNSSRYSFWEEPTSGSSYDIIKDSGDSYIYRFNDASRPKDDLIGTLTFVWEFK